MISYPKNLFKSPHHQNIGMDARDFKKFSFVGVTSPGAWGVVLLVALLGTLIGLGSEVVLEPKLTLDPILFSALFILFNLFTAFSIDRLVPEFRTKWCYFIVLLNQITLIAVIYLLTASSHITFLDSMVLWTTVSYSLWMLAMSGLAGLRIGIKSILLSFLQGALFWLLAFYSMDLGQVNTIAPFGLMAVGIGISTLVIIFNEHIFSLVFKGMSGMVELSKFLKGIRGEQVSLDLGHDIQALVQYIRFKTGSEESVMIAPWLHSGPIRSVGGGNLSSQCIEMLNKKKGPSYFFHVPSNHEYNPAGKISHRLVNAIRPGTFKPLRASEVVSVEKEGITVSGQRMNDTYLISLSSGHIDDYDINIFASLREKYQDKKIVFIDSHHNIPMKTCHNVEAFSKEALIIGELVGKVVTSLSKKRLSPAKIGTAFRELDQYSVFALIVEAKKKTLYFVTDTNGISDEEARNVLKAARSLGVDAPLLYSTDTHALPLKHLINRPDTPREIASELIREALSNLKPAKFSFGESKLDRVRVLGDAYYELATIVRIMARVTPLLFFLLFLFLSILLWIF
jgi:predicted neutral ceramidase superfamily lipid hydrolase